MGYLNPGKIFIAIFAIAAILFYLPLTLVSAYAEDKTEECLKGDPEHVELMGEFYAMTIPREVGSESQEQGWGSGTLWVLKLDSPICVTVLSKDNIREKRVVRDVKEITIFPARSEYEGYRNLVHEKVVVTGALSETVTGGYIQTPLSMEHLRISLDTTKAENAGCLESKPYNPHHVKLVGEFYEEPFAVPPESGNKTKGDIPKTQPETQWILKLDSPVCIIAETDDPREVRILRNVKEVTLEIGIHMFVENLRSIYDDFKPLMHNRVAVTGKLSPAHTANNLTPVSSEVIDIGLTYAGDKNEICFQGDPAFIKLKGAFYERSFHWIFDFKCANNENLGKNNLLDSVWVLKLDHPVCLIEISEGGGGMNGWCEISKRFRCFLCARVCLRKNMLT